MATSVIPTIKVTTNPTSNENVAAGYPLGQHWFNESTGVEYIHKTDGVWLSGFFDAQYDDILPSTEWTSASGGTASDTATHTIGGMAANYKAFDGVTTEESMVSSFEILHAVDVASLNAETLKMEIHTHGSTHNERKRDLGKFK